jgi:hypothetical protein
MNMLKESFRLIKKHKAYFFAPIILFLVFLSIFAFVFGPKAVLAFIYAGL